MIKHAFKTVVMCKWFTILASAVVLSSCVTETVDNAPRFAEAAVVSVQSPNARITAGSKVAWHPDAVSFIADKRLGDTRLKSLIEQQIQANLKQKGLVVVDKAAGARYTIAYTAALSSALDDDTIIRRYGLLPGNTQIPENDASIEKGSLIIYMFENMMGGVIWRSAAQAGVHFDMSDEERAERVAAVITAMFQSLPVEQAGDQAGD
jgi:hypothetical protein